jgi:hypothetical protein
VNHPAFSNIKYGAERKNEKEGFTFKTSPDKLQMADYKPNQNKDFESKLHHTQMRYASPTAGAGAGKPELASDAYSNVSKNGKLPNHYRTMTEQFFPTASFVNAKNRL